MPVALQRSTHAPEPCLPPRVELVFFTGCPHVEAARAALRTALANAGSSPTWQEWDQSSPTAPFYVRGFGSPTVLVDGADVTGVGALATECPCCRVTGGPGAAVIASALRRAARPRAARDVDRR